MPTNQEVQAWFAANPNASDAQIASAMAQHGVTARQVANATGTGLQNVQERLTATAPQLSLEERKALMPLRGSMYGGNDLYSDEEINKYIADNGLAGNLRGIQHAARQHGVGTRQLSRAMGRDHGDLRREFASIDKQNMANRRGLDPNDPYYWSSVQSLPTARHAIGEQGAANRYKTTVMNDRNPDSPLRSYYADRGLGTKRGQDLLAMEQAYSGSNPTSGLRYKGVNPEWQNRMVGPGVHDFYNKAGVPTGLGAARTIDKGTGNYTVYDQYGSGKSYHTGLNAGPVSKSQATTAYQQKQIDPMGIVNQLLAFVPGITAPQLAQYLGIQPAQAQQMLSQARPGLIAGAM